MHILQEDDCLVHGIYMQGAKWVESSSSFELSQSISSFPTPLPVLRIVRLVPVAEDSIGDARRTVGNTSTEVVPAIPSECDDMLEGGEVGQTKAPKEGEIGNLLRKSGGLDGGTFPHENADSRKNAAQGCPGRDKEGLLGNGVDIPMYETLARGSTIICNFPLDPTHKVRFKIRIISDAKFWRILGFAFVVGSLSCFPCLLQMLTYPAFASEDHFLGAGHKDAICHCHTEYVNAGAICNRMASGWRRLRA